MINTLSICPVCYKRIPASIVFRGKAAWMVQNCPVHGAREGLIDPDSKIVTQFYNTGTLGKNKAILVPITDKCNMECSWCYTKGVDIPIKPPEFYDRHLIDLKTKGYTILLSGGEPTTIPDFHGYCRELMQRGWSVVTMSNMLAFADPLFMQETINVGMVTRDGTLCVDWSMQHPTNYNGEIAAQKYAALSNLERFGVKANCIQFSIGSLNEIPWIRQFYNDTKHLYNHLRIRSLHGFWKDDSEKIYLSQLLDGFQDHFGDLTPMLAGPGDVETSNIYSIYLRTAFGGISLSSAPTVGNVDLLNARRPTYGWALDQKYYSFPVAQIISEGIEKGWYNGYRLDGHNGGQEVSDVA